LEAGTGADRATLRSVVRKRRIEGRTEEEESVSGMEVRVVQAGSRVVGVSGTY
jgi:hypothetical protein